MWDKAPSYPFPNAFTQFRSQEISSSYTVTFHSTQVTNVTCFLNQVELPYPLVLRVPQIQLLIIQILVSCHNKLQRTCAGPPRNIDLDCHIFLLGLSVPSFTFHRSRFKLNNSKLRMEPEKECLAKIKGRISNFSFYCQWPNRVPLKWLWTLISKGFRWWTTPKCCNYYLKTHMCMIRVFTHGMFLFAVTFITWSFTAIHVFLASSTSLAILCRSSCLFFSGSGLRLDNGNISIHFWDLLGNWESIKQTRSTFL